LDLQSNSRTQNKFNFIAIVDKENDSLVLRLGAAVLAKGSVFAINEIGSMSLENQQHLIDVAEEGRCTVDKYRMHFEIDAPTTIIATANPYNATWSRRFNLTKDEIPTLKTFLDRCDQVYGFRDAPSDEEIKEYTEKKSQMRKRKTHNYNFLKKYLTYIRNVKSEITEEAEDRLNKFWIKAKVDGAATNRTYDSIFRLAEAQAKLTLSNEVDDDIATKTMESISLMLSRYGTIVETVSSPKDITYEAFFNILKNTKAALSVQELCKIACEESKQVAEYLGNKWLMENNRKIKPIVDMLLNYHNKDVKKVKMKPMVLQYIEEGKDYSAVSDATDISDILKKSYVESSKVKNEILSDMSERSDGRIQDYNNDTNNSNNVTYKSDLTDALLQSAKENQNYLTKSMPDKSHRSVTSEISQLNGEPAVNPDIPHKLQTQGIVQTIYRLGHSDIWACKDCKQKGDVHYMEQHLCSSQ
jgi:DNA replicative helicase MCM subunit Mcm2 (Cdc46/Mcm family)